MDYLMYAPDTNLRSYGVPMALSVGAHKVALWHLSHLKCSFLPSTSVTGPTYVFRAVKTKYSIAPINAATNIGAAQFNPAAVTGVCCGQKAQKKHHVPYTTAATLTGIPHLPNENWAGGRVSGWLSLRQRS